MTLRLSQKYFYWLALAIFFVLGLTTCNGDSSEVGTAVTFRADATATSSVATALSVTPTTAATTVVKLHPSQLSALSTDIGFSDFSYAANVDALLETYVLISRESNLISLHLDGGVPWSEALANERYAERFANELGAKAALFPQDMTRFVSITPINFDRNGLAAYRGNTANEPLTDVWKSRSFDHPEVVEAYLNYARSIINGFNPDFFAYAIEANYLSTFNPSSWGSFVGMAAQVYGTLKEEYPELPLIITFNHEEFLRSPESQTRAINDLLPYTDLLVVSTYPFFILNDADRVTTEYFDKIIELAPDKAFAISETGWPAQQIPDEGDLLVAGSEMQQTTYVRTMLDVVDEKEALFMVWFFTRDFDELWDTTLSTHTAAGKLRMFRDLGLFDGNGNPRPALEIWRSALSEH
ncbi:MAG: hypothetical protein HQ477_10720 [Chloroflexi bacterium]|nr:hypothetical protein [Chloroflexota bacterium]